MGHSRIGTLPQSRPWQEVVRLIAGESGVREIAAATTRAAERSLHRHADDPVLHHAFYLLTQIPIAARSEDVIGSFRRLGVFVGPDLDLVAITTALMEALDRLSATTGGHRSDLGEMAQLAATESLQAVAGSNAQTLFDSETSEAARSALAALATPKQFGVLGRDFLARLVRRCLDYYLSRELPNHVGAARRFQSLKDHRLFEEALDSHCRETARIVEAFAGDWFSKANYEGGITPEKAGAFVHHAFSKLRAELRHRGPDGSSDAAA